MHKARSGWLLGIIFFLIFFVAQATAQTVTANGLVKGKDGYPKRFATVQVNGYVTSTNAEGAFRIVNVKPGRYQVRVKEKTQVQEFSNVNIDAGHTIELMVGW